MQLNYLIVGLLAVTSSSFTAAKDPDNGRTFQELIESRNLTLLTYSVTTEDGYILTIHRVVPQDYNERTYSAERRPVIIQHGLLGSASNYFTNSPFLEPQDEESECTDDFGICLLQTGRYDVWLPNSRGNGYSNGHIRSDLTPKNRKYWEFTFDHMAVYDTPAVIGKVLNVTGHDRVAFIGYSQGSNIMMALLSLSPEYADIVQPFISWAPPAYIGNMSSILRFLRGLIRPLQLLGGEFSFSDPMIRNLLSPFCGAQIPGLPGLPGINAGGVLCKTTLELMMGKTNHLNETRLPTYLSSIPSPVSNWDMAHFGQLYTSKDFVRYDYGSRQRNREVYDQDTAPAYPLENIPEGYKIYIFRGETDGFIAPEDAESLIDKLRSVGVNVTDYPVPSKTWNHLDYILGMDAGKLVHDKTIEFLDEFYEEN